MKYHLPPIVFGVAGKAVVLLLEKSPAGPDVSGWPCTFFVPEVSIPAEQTNIVPRVRCIGSHNILLWVYQHFILQLY